MIGFAMGHRANNTNLIGDFCGLVEVLGKVNAFDAGFDGAERSAIFDGSKNFGIERFLRCDASGKKDVNDRLGDRFGTRGLGLELEKISESQANTPDQADE